MKFDRPFERAHARLELDDRRDRAHRRQRRRCVRRVFAGELQREISAERVAGHDDAVEAVAMRELADHEGGVLREAGMVEAGTQMLGASAVALVQQDRR